MSQSYESGNPARVEASHPNQEVHLLADVLRLPSKLDSSTTGLYFPEEEPQGLYEAILRCPSNIT